jgi:hypothetical protein
VESVSRGTEQPNFRRVSTFTDNRSHERMFGAITVFASS